MHNVLEQLFLDKRLGGAIKTITRIGAFLLPLVITSCSINIQIKKNTKMTNKKKNVTANIPPFNTPFKIYGATAEQNNGQSQTVEGESYTIQELIKRHVNGLMPPVGLTPLYDHDEPTHDDYIGMRKPDFDLTDIDEIKNKVKDANEKISKAQKAKQSKAKEAEQIDRLSIDKAENQQPKT